MSFRMYLTEIEKHVCTESYLHQFELESTLENTHATCSTYSLEHKIKKEHQKEEIKLWLQLQ